MAVRGHMGRSRGLRHLFLALTAAAVATGTTLALSAAPAQAATTGGIDVSHHQGTINWASAASAGTRFAYIKATEGIDYTDPMFDTNYIAATKAKIVRGAYHFALPDRSTGAAQADFVFANGGAWSADDITLPAAVDLEYNPYGATCYGLTKAQMRTWIASFLNRYKALSGRYAVIYTTTDWWTTCTGNYSGFAATSPLWIARYNTAVGTLPAGWSTWSFWQYTSTGSVSGVPGNVDRDTFNGSDARLLALANNTA